jgi:CysZ protein
MFKPFYGASYFLRGLTLLPKKGIFPYVIIPMIINALLFTLAAILSIAQIGDLIEWIMPQLPDWLQWLYYLMWVFFTLATLIVVFFLVVLLSNIIAAPFNTLLAEAVERHLGHQPEQNSISNLTGALAEFPKAIGNEVVKLGYFAKLAIPLLILFLIPGINLVAPFLWIIFSAWMLTLEYSDFHLGNHGMLFKKQREILGQEKMLCLGFGGASMLATLIPVLNFIAIPASVAGATVMLVERNALEKPQI